MFKFSSKEMEVLQQMYLPLISSHFQALASFLARVVLPDPWFWWQKVVTSYSYYRVYILLENSVVLESIHTQPTYSVTVKPDVLLTATLQTSTATLVFWLTVSVEQVATCANKLELSIRIWSSNLPSCGIHFAVKNKVSQAQFQINSYTAQYSLLKRQAF